MWCSKRQKYIKCHYIEKADISTTDISRTQQLTQKLFRWINGTTGQKKNMYFLFKGELSLECEKLIHIVGLQTK